MTVLGSYGTMDGGFEVLTWINGEHKINQHNLINFRF